MRYKLIVTTTKTISVFLLLLGMVQPIKSQDLEYKMEIGGALGGSFYMGDANYSTLFRKVNIAGGLIGRYHLNPHMSIKLNLLMAQIAGDTQLSDNKFPEGQSTQFKRTLYDLGGQFEYNFFGFGAGKSYKGKKRLTPYLLGGLGITYAPQPATSIFTVNIPMGIGLKYKLTERLNLGCEFSMRFTLSDQLDVTQKEGLLLNDPYQIKGSGFKNKDTYSVTTISITYDISPKYRRCNN